MFHVMCKKFILSPLQLLLVSGGRTGAGGYTWSVGIDTTEIFDGSTWTNVGRLPRMMDGIRIINIDNQILSFGI